MKPYRQMVAVLACASAIAASAASAQQQPGNPPPVGQKANKACFNQKELQAEAEVRTGIQLREIFRRCAELYPDGQQALQDWYAFDNTNATKLRSAVDTRRQALVRIYPDRTALTQWETDSAVATMKSVQVNDGVCKATYDVMTKLKKDQWKGFQYYAKLQESLLAYELPICRK